MEESIKSTQERMYLALAALAMMLSMAGKTMTCDEVIEWINLNFRFPHHYVSVRGVFQAAYRRGTKEQQEALASVFRSKHGSRLC